MTELGEPVGVVRFPPHPRSGLIGRFGLTDLLLFAATLGCVWWGLNLLAHHWIRALVLFATGVVVAVPAVLPRIGGRRATEYIGPIIGTGWDRVTGRGAYRGAVYAPASLADRLDLPGDLAGFRMISVPAVDGITRIGVMVHDRERVAVAVAPTSGTTLELLDGPRRSELIAGWDTILAQLAGPDLGVRRWQLLIRHTPDMANLAAAHANRAATVRVGPPWNITRALVDGPAAAAHRHQVLLAIEFDLHRLTGPLDQIDTRHGDEAVGAVIRDRLTDIDRALHDGGIRSNGWLRPGQFAGVLRTQFDPTTLPLHDLTDPAGDLDPRLAGPAAADRSWRHYRHDSAISQTLWVHEMPGRDVPLTFLGPLLQVGGARRTVSIVAQPLDEATAQHHLQRQSERAEQAVRDRSKRGLFVTARSRKEAAATAAQDAALADADTLFCYQMFITVTATDQAQLARDVLTVQRQVRQAHCDAVVLYGEQDQAFYAGALPLARGLIPLRGRLH